MARPTLPVAISPTRLDSWLYRLAALVICAELLLVFLLKSGINAHQGNAALEDLMILNPEYARRPFANRVLVPQLTRALFQPLRPFKSRLDSLAWRTPVIATLLERFEARRTYYTQDDVRRTFDHTTEALACWVVMYAFFVGFVFSMRRLLCFVRGDDRMRSLALASTLALVPFMNVGLLWDPATLFFWALLPALMLERQWRLYCLVYILACLNRETTILLTVVFICSFHGQMNRAAFWRLIVFQVVAAVIVRAVIDHTLRVRGVAGAALEWHLSNHFVRGSLVTIDQIVLAACVVLGTVAVLRSRRTRILLGEAAIIPIFFTAYVLFGQPGEIRALYELVPLGVVVVTPGLLSTPLRA